VSHYHDSDDLRIVGEIKTLAPVEFGGFVALALKLFDQLKGDPR
jgi:hypothetical protein